MPLALIQPSVLLFTHTQTVSFLFHSLSDDLASFFFSLSLSFSHFVLYFINTIVYAINNNNTDINLYIRLVGGEHATRHHIHHHHHHQHKLLYLLFNIPIVIIIIIITLWIHCVFFLINTIVVFHIKQQNQMVIYLYIYIVDVAFLIFLFYI